MNWNNGRDGMTGRKMAAGFLGMGLTMVCLVAGGQTAPIDSSAGGDAVKTFYLTNLSSPDDANEVQTDLRNMLPKAKMFYVPSQGAITVRGSAEEIALAQKILADLDKTKKLYRLTFTINESEEGKRIGSQHYAMVVASGSKTELKQGSKVPIVTGSYNTGAAAAAQANTQVQYLDIGLNIDARLDSYLDGVRMYVKVEQSSLGEERPMGSQDPVIRQTRLEGTSTLVQGKPLVLGSLDIPGSTRHQEIEVVAYLIH